MQYNKEKNNPVKSNNKSSEYPKKTANRNIFIHTVLVLLTCWVITYLIWDYVNTTAQNELRSYFEFRAREVNERIEQRLANYEQVLRSERGLFNVSDNVNRAEFHTFFNSLHLDENYPGIQGVGFSLIIPSKQIKKHIASVRAEGFSKYKIWPEDKRETYTSIIYLEPFKNLNLRAFGYDMFSEPVRRRAMETARDSDESKISGKITLVQEAGKQVQAGFLIYLPVYRNGAPIKTLQERRANIVGWVYSPFRMDDFMAGLLGERSTELHVEIYDGNKISNETKMYDSQTHPLKSNDILTLSKEIIFDGHKWTVIVNSKPELESRIGFNYSIIILIVGLVLSILLAIITWQIEKKRMLRKVANTERRQAEKEIMVRNEQLIKLNAEKDKFFSIIAHDLKSPFTGFLNLTELMADNTEEFSQAEFIKNSKSLNEAARYLYKLLENLLEWAQMQRGSISFVPKEINLSDIISQNIVIINQRALQKGITIINEVPASEIVYADEKMIATVLRNLLSNAVKFTKRDGKVLVRSKKADNGMVEISVSDDGIGLSEKDIKRLFKIEEKVSSKGTEGEPSTGLGLLLCKEFVELNKGEISVESETGKGSTFSFTLPLNKKK